MLMPRGKLTACKLAIESAYEQGKGLRSRESSERFRYLWVGWVRQAEACLWVSLEPRDMPAVLLATLRAALIKAAS